MSTHFDFLWLRLRTVIAPPGHAPALRRLVLGLLLLTLCAGPVYASPPPEKTGATSAGGGCTDLSLNGGFETGNFTGWTTWGSPTVLSTGGHSGTHMARLGGRNNAADTIAQTVSCPFVWGYAQVTFWLYIYSEAPPGTSADYLALTSVFGTHPATGSFYSESSLARNQWLQLGFTIDNYASGQWQLIFQVATDSVYPTTFLIDDVEWRGCCASDAYEPNDTFRSASAAAHGVYDLLLCPVGDEDWFRFDTTAGQQIALWLEFQEPGQGAVCLLAPDGTEIGCDWAQHPAKALVAHTATASGSWRARVYDPGNTTGTALKLYVVLVNQPTPTASATLPAAATPTRTAVATLTRTATRTRTRTPWPTLPGGVKRLNLPLLLRGH